MKHQFYLLSILLFITVSYFVKADVLSKQHVISNLKERLDKYRNAYPLNIKGGNDDPTVSNTE